MIEVAVVESLQRNAVEDAQLVQTASLLRISPQQLLLAGPLEHQ